MFQICDTYNYSIRIHSIILVFKLGYTYNHTSKYTIIEFKWVYLGILGYTWVYLGILTLIRVVVLFILGYTYKYTGRFFHCTLLIS